jgi:hypothetical protein
MANKCFLQRPHPSAEGRKKRIDVLIIIKHLAIFAFILVCFA